MPDDFNAHELVDAIMNPSIDQSTGQDQTPPEAGAAPPPQAAPAPPPEIQDYERKLATAEKRYNDLQSDIDRRINTAVRPLFEKIDTLTSELTQRQAFPEGEEQQFDPQKLARLVADEASRAADKKIREALESDERLKAAQLISDTARFRSAHPESQQATPLIEKFMQKLPWVPRSEEGLNAVYGLITDLVTEAQQAQARATEEAGKNNRQPQPTQPPYGQVTPVQAQQMAANAQRYAPEQGLSASTTVKPSINRDGDMRTELEKMVRATMEKQGY